MKLNYNQMADICLKADGGYCYSCALDVAEGFSESDSSIDLEELKKIIDKKIKDHEKQTELEYQEYRKRNPVTESGRRTRLIEGVVSILTGVTLAGQASILKSGEGVLG